MHKEHAIDIVGDRRVLRDLRHPSVVGESGRPRKRVLFVLGGGQAGIITAERLHVFAHAGISIDHFDLVVGISAGAYNILGFGSKQTAIMRQIYFAFCEFPMNARMYYLVSEIDRQFDRATFEQSKPEILIGVSDSKGKLSLPSAKKEPGLFGLLYAASAVPPLTFGVDPRGNNAYDGAFAHPCPVRQALRLMSDTWGRECDIDILLLANRPRPALLPWYDPLIYWFGVNVIMRMWTPGLCDGANTIDAKVGALIPMFEKKHRMRYRTCAWFPRQYISPLEWNRYALNMQADAVKCETEDYLATAGY